MPRMRRLIKARGLYEITFRARETIPFPCTQYMALVLYSVLARVQRDSKVILHHFLFEGSHPHILCTAQDAEQCHRFYGQLQKQITDAIKRLTGLRYLNLWEARANVCEIPTLEDAIEKVRYLYTNPSNDDLVDCIEAYPGVSSWAVYTSAAAAIDGCELSEHPWIRLPSIPLLPSHAITPRQDKFIAEKMLSQSKKKHSLQIFPNLWMKRFLTNPSAEDVQRINEEIVQSIRETESANSACRAKTNKKPLGAENLITQPLLKPHTPKKRGIKIFVQSKFHEVRIRFIQEMKAIDALCRATFQRWKQGDFNVIWPPGTFPPPLPPQATMLA